MTMKGFVPRLSISLLMFILLALPASATWSIVAVDSATGDVGVALASCVPLLHGDGLAALVPRKGAAAIQAQFTLRNRNTVFQLLQEGSSAEYQQGLAKLAEDLKQSQPAKAGVPAAGGGETSSDQL